MENQETNQPENLTEMVGAPSYGITEVKTEKGCKTCKSKTLSKGNINIIILGSSLIFLMFYGLVSLIKDIGSLFTR